MVYYGVWDYSRSNAIGKCKIARDKAECNFTFLDCIANAPVFVEAGLLCNYLYSNIDRRGCGCWVKVRYGSGVGDQSIKVYTFEQLVCIVMRN